MAQSEIIVVQVGCDGGSLTVEGKHYGDTGWRFRTEKNDIALYDNYVDDDNPRKSPAFSSDPVTSTRLTKHLDGSTNTLGSICISSKFIPSSPMRC